MHISQNQPFHLKLGLLLTLLAALTLSFSACKNDTDNTPSVPTITEQIAMGNEFTLFKAALTQAGLDATLSSPGTYTVFAPTNAAFQAFGFTSETAIKLAPVDLLKNVLLYHVLGTRLEVSAIPTAVNTPQQTQLLASPVYITKTTSTTSTSTTSTSGLSVNGAHILSSQVGTASNGLIYAIDRILLPPVYGDIPNTIVQIPAILAVLSPTAGFSFKLLQQAVARTGAGSALTATGPLTVFAPTDAAFQAAGFDSTAIANAPVAQLQAVLSYHVVPNSRIYTPLITSSSSFTTLQGGTVTAAASTSAVTVTGAGNGGVAANITGADITASNGVVQIIDRLLLPQ